MKEIQKHEEMQFRHFVTRQSPSAQHIPKVKYPIFYDPQSQGTHVSITSCLSILELNQIHVQTVSGTIYIALDDYSVDNRGDVGSWVRIAAAQSTGEWISHLVDRHESVIIALKI